MAGKTRRASVSRTQSRTHPGQGPTRESLPGGMLSRYLADLLRGEYPNLDKQLIQRVVKGGANAELQYLNELIQTMWDEIGILHEEREVVSQYIKYDRAAKRDHAERLAQLILLRTQFLGLLLTREQHVKRIRSMLRGAGIIRRSFITSLDELRLLTIKIVEIVASVYLCTGKKSELYTLGFDAPRGQDILRNILTEELFTPDVMAYIVEKFVGRPDLMDQFVATEMTYAQGISEPNLRLSDLHTGEAMLQTRGHEFRLVPKASPATKIFAHGTRAPIEDVVEPEILTANSPTSRNSQRMSVESLMNSANNLQYFLDLPCSGAALASLMFLMGGKPSGVQPHVGVELHTTLLQLMPGALVDPAHTAGIGADKAVEVILEYFSTTKQLTHYLQPLPACPDFVVRRAAMVDKDFVFSVLLLDPFCYYADLERKRMMIDPKEALTPLSPLPRTEGEYSVVPTSLRATKRAQLRLATIPSGTSPLQEERPAPFYKYRSPYLQLQSMPDLRSAPLTAPSTATTIDKSKVVQSQRTQRGEARNVDLYREIDMISIERSKGTRISEGGARVPSPNSRSTRSKRSLVEATTVTRSIAQMTSAKTSSGSSGGTTRRSQSRSRSIKKAKRIQMHDQSIQSSEQPIPPSAPGPPPASFSEREEHGEIVTHLITEEVTAVIPIEEDEVYETESPTKDTVVYMPCQDESVPSSREAAAIVNEVLDGYDEGFDETPSALESRKDSPKRETVHIPVVIESQVFAEIGEPSQDYLVEDGRLRPSPKIAQHPSVDGRPCSRGIGRVAPCVSTTPPRPQDPYTDPSAEVDVADDLLEAQPVVDLPNEGDPIIASGYEADFAESFSNEEDIAAADAVLHSVLGRQAIPAGQ
ncbi:hypothetical protein GMRT_13634 [Giardia muris]|uniref:Uncharacterized protein n=1 Tax=Giardia muris TaxID=5742 RepID=A0A4Z1SKK2_GIAMU|nr:hypothetical protein GMRT_13634 [Giardia muris]|eukprot:TNJ26184.1 hypothetical protein GMRT_13634 [Giardia muris]